MANIDKIQNLIQDDESDGCIDPHMVRRSISKTSTFRKKVSFKNSLDLNDFSISPLSPLFRKMSQDSDFTKKSKDNSEKVPSLSFPDKFSIVTEEVEPPYEHHCALNQNSDRNRKNQQIVRESTLNIIKDVYGIREPVKK